MGLIRDYSISVDINYERFNSIIKFYISDKNSSSFKIYISRAGKPLDIKSVNAYILIIKPDNTVSKLNIENKETYFYVNLPDNLKDQIGRYSYSLYMEKDIKKVACNQVLYYDVCNDMPNWFLRGLNNENCKYKYKNT